MNWFGAFLIGVALWVALVFANITGLGIDRRLESLKKDVPTDVAFYGYGFYQKGNVWSRIRVDEKGRVICSDTAK